MVKVSFLNEAMEVDAPPGKTIDEVAEQEGVILIRGLFPGLHCHGHGVCGRCRVWAQPLAEGSLSPRTFFERVRRYRGQRRLACQARVLGNVEVRTAPNAPPPGRSTVWPADPRPSEWKQRAAAAAEADATAVAKADAGAAAKAAAPSASSSAEPKDAGTPGNAPAKTDTPAA